MKLAINRPRRLFTFGCSFTDYKWATWANILAYELNCEFYNFGRSGAGNYFISNQITQANNYFSFDKNDLVVVCWTNISREDRYTEKQGWVTPGNIYSQNEYDAKFVKRWANDIHFALRDFALIDLTANYLDCTNFNFLSMCNIVNQINQWEETSSEQQNLVYKISNLYNKNLSKIAPSFYDVLWQGNIDSKWQKDWSTVHKNYSDGHPTPLEHLEYLQAVLDYEFSSKTIASIKKLQENWVSYIRNCYRNSKKSHGLHDFPQTVENDLRQKFKLTKGRPIPCEIWN